MYLSEIFEQLTYGELNQLSIVDGATGTVLLQNYPKVISHITLALTALHKALPLRLEEIIVQQYEGIGTYYLQKKYAVNGGSAEPIKYLIDSVNDPFENTVFKIESVTDELGEKIPLNDPTQEESFYTPSFNELQIPNPESTKSVGVTYRSDHKPIVLSGLNPATEEINIPTSLLEPLLFYIAFRAYSSVPALENRNQSMEYYAKYEAAIKQIKDEDLINTDDRTNEKLGNRGWV